MTLRADMLTKKYKDLYVLRDVNIDLKSGVYGLLGPAGAGKSTLVNILEGNTEQTSGEVYFDGTDIRKMGHEYRRLLGYMPRKCNLYEGFSVWDFLFCAAIWKKTPPEKIKKRLIELSEQMNFRNVLKKKLRV